MSIYDVQKICSLCAAEQLAVWQADLLVDVGQDRVNEPDGLLWEHRAMVQLFRQAEVCKIYIMKRKVSMAEVEQFCAKYLWVANSCCSYILVVTSHCVISV